MFIIVVIYFHKFIITRSEVWALKMYSMFYLEKRVLFYLKIKKKKNTFFKRNNQIYKLYDYYCIN